MIEPGVALSTLAYSGVAGAGVGTAIMAVRWAAYFIAGRLDVKEDRLDAGMKALFDRLHAEVDRLTAECRELREWRKKAEAELDECHRRHASAEAEVKGLKAMFQGYGDARQIAALQTAADKADKKAEE